VAIALLRQLIPLALSLVNNLRLCVCLCCQGAVRQAGQSALALVQVLFQCAELTGSHDVVAVWWCRRDADTDRRRCSSVFCFSGRVQATTRRDSVSSCRLPRCFTSLLPYNALRDRPGWRFIPLFYLLSLSRFLSLFLHYLLTLSGFRSAPHGPTSRAFYFIIIELANDVITNSLFLLMSASLSGRVARPFTGPCPLALRYIGLDRSN